MQRRAFAQSLALHFAAIDFGDLALRIADSRRRAAELGAQIVVTPEMSLVGYPPRDLVFKTQFLPFSLDIQALATGHACPSGRISQQIASISCHRDED